MSASRDKKTGEFGYKPYAAQSKAIQQRLAGLKSSEWYDGEIARRQQEIQRLIDAEMPEDERAAQQEAQQETTRRVRQEGALEMAQTLAKVRWSDLKKADAAKWAAEKLRSGTPEEKREAWLIVQRLLPRANLGLDTAGVRDVEF